MPVLVMALILLTDIGSILVENVNTPAACRDFHRAQRECARGRCDAEKLERLRAECRKLGGPTDWYAAPARHDEEG